MTRREKIFGYIGLLLILVVLLSIASAFFINRSSQLVQQDAKTALSEISGQIVARLVSNIQTELKSLQTQSLYISHYEDIQDPEIMRILQRESIKSGFLRIGVVLPDGSSVNSDNIPNNIFYRDYFQRSMKGEIVVSDVLPFAIDYSIPVIVLSVPIFKEGRVVGVLRGTRTVEEYAKIITLPTFGNEGHSYLVRKTGEIVLAGDCSDCGLMLSERPFSENVVFLSNPDLSTMAQNMLRYENGMVEFGSADTVKYVDYRPLGINDWYLITVVPASIMLNRVAGVIRLSTFMILTFLAIFIVILSLFFIFRERKRMQLERIAFYDSLTGLGNFEHMRYSTKGKLRDLKHKGYCFMLLDVDNFKYINELIGYTNGNLALRFITGVLLRHTAADEYLCRVMNDRFALLIKEPDRLNLEGRMDKLLQELAEIHNEPEFSPFEGLSVSYSFGLYPIVDENLTLDSYLDRAIIALNVAKKKHNSAYAYYDETLHHTMRQRKELEDRFPTALEKGEFEIYLQPKYYVHDLELAGAEALVRWNHPSRGLLGPNLFIPFLEESGLIVELDSHVFSKVCALERKWIDEERPLLRVSANISRFHLLSPRFLDTYDGILHTFHIPRNLIELELTETAFSDNSLHVREAVANLKKRGFLVSMDDFGTGFSTLNLLKDIDVDIIKIDRMFLKDFEKGGKSETVIRHVIELTADLGITVVAEGVESEAQLNFLRAINCTMVQGFLFARPMPIADFERLWDDSINAQSPTSV